MSLKFKMKENLLKKQFSYAPSSLFIIFAPFTTSK